MTQNFKKKKIFSLNDPEVLWYIVYSPILFVCIELFKLQDYVSDPYFSFLFSPISKHIKRILVGMVQMEGRSIESFA